MKFAELNRYQNTVKAGIDTAEMEFRALKDFIGATLHVDGFFFNEGKYGKQVVVVANGWLINMPSRAVEQFETISKNEELLNAMLGGHLAIDGIKMVDTKNGTTTAYTLKDC